MTVPTDNPSLTERVAAAYRELGRHGLVTGAAGNVSVRTAGGMSITTSGSTAETATADGVVTLDREGRTDENKKPSSEWFMHAAIYREFPGAAAVVHTHSNACSALACLREDMPAFHYNVVGFGGDSVRCARYATFGTPDLAVAVVEALRERNACLLANHGMICFGADLTQALGRAIRLEALAYQYLLARAAGRPHILSDAEIASVRERYKTYGDLSPSAKR